MEERAQKFFTKLAGLMKSCNCTIEVEDGRVCVHFPNDIPEPNKWYYLQSIPSIDMGYNGIRVTEDKLVFCRQEKRFIAA